VLSEELYIFIFLTKQFFILLYFSLVSNFTNINKWSENDKIRCGCQARTTSLNKVIIIVFQSNNVHM